MADQRRVSQADSEEGSPQVVMPVYNNANNQMSNQYTTVRQSETTSVSPLMVNQYSQSGKMVNGQYYSGLNQTSNFGQGGASYTSYQQGPVTTTSTVTTNQYSSVPQINQYSNQTGALMTGGQSVVSGGQFSTGEYQTAAQYAASQSQRRISQHSVVGKEYVTGTRVVGHEYGEQRVISTTQRVDESRASILSERFVEHEIKVPKKIVREEVIEKVIVVPERLLHEEVIEEVQKVREKIIEVAKPIIQEKIVEVPEIEYVERIVEVPERIVQEKIREVPRIEYQERIVEIPKIITQEKIVEVPDIQYRDVPYERVVEVPEIHEEFVVKEIPVPQYVDKPVPQYVDVEVVKDVERNIPVPVEAITTFEYKMPRLRPRYNKVTYPVYLPRFIEVPVALELLNSDLISMAEKYLAQVKVLSGTAASLCEIENLAANIMKADFQTHLASADLQSAVMKAWQSGILQFSGPQPTLNVGSQHNTTTVTTTTQGYMGSPVYQTTTVGKTHSHKKSHKSKSGKSGSRR